MLLSVELMARIEAEGFRRDPENANIPVARNTKFGWMVSLADNQKIAENVERLWKLDEVSAKPMMTAEEELFHLLQHIDMRRKPNTECSYRMSTLLM